jgi:hypothetical protein
MNIGNVNVAVSEDAAGWDFKVDYTLNFSQTEVDSNFEFEHAVVLWEYDGDDLIPNDDDKLWTLTNAVINPSFTSVPISRTFPNLPGDSLDTEEGGEEIWAEVYARNRTTAGGVLNKRSALVHIAPE